MLNRRRFRKCKQFLSGEIQNSNKIEESTEDEFYYADEVQNRSATFVGGYDENNVENNNSQSEIEEFIKAQKADNPHCIKTKSDTNTLQTAKNVYEQKADNPHCIKTKSDTNTLERHLRSVSGEKVQIENLPPAKLDHLLCKCFIL